MEILTQEEVQNLAPDSLSHDPQATLTHSRNCMNETGNWSPNQQMGIRWALGAWLRCIRDHATMQSGL